MLFYFGVPEYLSVFLQLPWEVHAFMIIIFQHTASLISPSLAGRFFPTSTTWKALQLYVVIGLMLLAQSLVETLLLLALVLGKDAKKTLRSYLLQDNLLNIKEEGTSQRRGGPGQGKQ